MATRVTRRRLNASSKSSSSPSQKLIFSFSVVVVVRFTEAEVIELFDMEGTKRVSLGARKKSKRKNRRLVRNIVDYLKSDGYMFAPLFSNFPPLAPQIQMHPQFNSESSNADDVSIAGFEVLGLDRVNKKKRRMSENVKEYLKSDCHMYGPTVSPLKLVSTLKGKLQTTNLVTMEVSTSSTTIREDTNHRNLRSDIAEQTLQKERINSPKRAVVILEGKRTGLNRETDFSPALSSLPEEKMVKPDQRRVTIE